MSIETLSFQSEQRLLQLTWFMAVYGLVGPNVQKAEDKYFVYGNRTG